MLSFKFRKNLLISLFILAIILIAASIIFKANLVAVVLDEDSIDRNEISERFKIILREFDIENKFIRENKIKDKYSGQEFSNIKVQVPKDLSIPEILEDVFQSFKKDSLIIQSIEKVKGGKSALSLKMGHSILLQVEFDYLKDYSRNNGYIAFILNNVDPASESTSALIESPEKLNSLIRPEIKHLQHLEFISKSGQQFSVLIDDDITEQKYRLGPNFSEQRIVTVIKTLVSDFQKAVCFIIDDNSNFYNSPNYEILKRELSKRNIKLIRKSEFVNLNYDETFIDSFNERMRSLNRGGSIVFLVNEESYVALNDEIKKYKKKGYRVITSSLIL